MGRAVWSVFAVVIALPLAWRDSGIDKTTECRPRKDIDLPSYGIACLAIASGTLFTSGVLPMLVVASIAFSLAGLLALLTSFRIPAVLAIGCLITHSILFLTWPVWGSHWMVRHDVQWLVDALVRVGPLFAINTAIDPTDPLTHRPMAYRLTNLGQDIPYALPTYVWWCVATHVLAGIPGLCVYRYTQATVKNGDEPRQNV